MTTPRLARVGLPDFGDAGPRPELPAAVYRDRLTRLRARMATRGLDRLVVYADREHSANLAWLTGFDPRFEEAIVVVGASGDPAILAGNECYGLAGAAPLPMRRHLSQDLSLPGQPRERSRPLVDILAAEGIGPGRRVGVVGWKTYAEPTASDAPAYLVDTLRALTGERESVVNATDLLIDAGDGLRVINEVEQLAAIEHAACQTSDGLRCLLTGLRPGMTEREAVRLLGWDGTPLSCHLMLSGGTAGHVRAAQSGRPADRARRPVHRRIRDLGRPHLPGRVPGRGRDRAAARDRRLRRPAGRAVLRRGRRMVRSAARRPDRWRPVRDHRPPPR